MVIFKCRFKIRGCSKSEPVQNYALQRIFFLTSPLAVMRCATEEQATLSIKSVSFFNFTFFNKTIRVWRKSTMKSNSSWAQPPPKRGQKGQRSLSITILNVPRSRSLFFLLLKPSTWYFSQLFLSSHQDTQTASRWEKAGTAPVAFQTPATTPSSSSGEESGLLLTDQSTSLSDADQDDVCRVVLMLIIKTDGFKWWSASCCLLILYL